MPERWIEQLQREDEELKRIDLKEELSKMDNKTTPQVQFKQVEKPPLGVTPRYIFMEKRYEELDRAIQEYMQSGRKINLDWIEERNDIIDYFNGYFEKQNGGK